MKNIYKNPIMYYIAVPVLVGLWPLLVWTIYLPAAQKKITQELDRYKEANTKMLQIVSLEPERLESVDPNNKDIQFTYDSVVYKIATIHGIPPSKCKLDSQGTVTSSGQRSQGAKVTLSQIDIVSFTQFLSTIESNWRPNLQCNSIKINQKSNMPDLWDITIDFKYYY